ncbi:MAG: Macrolide export protein MacA [Planctomycetota bacterium]|jgi:HlyD family secretion protein
MMRKLIKPLVVLLVLGALAGGGAAAYGPAARYWRERNRPRWRLADVARGELVAVVNSTGTVKPTLQITVGSFVSGPIVEIHGEYNQEVKKDELLARVDPRIYDAALRQQTANLKTRQAEVVRAKAQLQQAINDEKRAFKLRDEDPAFIAQAELDKITFAKQALEAQLVLAEASVEQADASVANAQAQVDYTEIKSPVDGIIINRKIDRGQTLAAQFQTPELFVIAPEMKERMHIHASVDEADIGLIRNAKLENLPVKFTIDAYPDDLFEGQIEEIRLSSTTTQNVVTYPVIVSAPNRELKLLPGMTASLSFQVDRRSEAIKIPNAALRFYPDVRYVHPDDRSVLEGQSGAKARDDSTADDSSEGKAGDSKRDGTTRGEADESAAADLDGNTPDRQLSAAERTAARKRRSRRHVWVVEGDWLRAIPVETGLSDSRYSELVSGDVRPGARLVTGITANRP